MTTALRSVAHFYPGPWPTFTSALTLRTLVVELLDEEGYAVIGAEGPSEAVTLLTETAFDLVITDGFSRASHAALASTSQVLEHAGATPTLLFTAHKVELDAAKAIGFRDLIEKPFDLNTLLGQIHSVLN